MSFGRIKIREADRLYSLWLRRERKRCEKCGRTTSLQCSHFWGRKAESTRFDPLNTDCLCFACHQYFEENPAAYAEWKRKRMSETEYKLLEIRAGTYKKRDDTLVLIWLKKEFGMETTKKQKECIHRMKPQYCAMCMPRKEKKVKKEK